MDGGGDPRNRGHGGARVGAGARRKYDFDTMVKIGQACETLWREASVKARETRLAGLPHADEIQALHDKANAIPVAWRKEWLASAEYEDHSGEIEVLLHKRAGHSPIGGFKAEGETFGGDYEGAAPRVFSVSTKPPRGTRKQIIGDVASERGLPETTVDNLWQAYTKVH